MRRYIYLDDDGRERCIHVPAEEVFVDQQIVTVPHEFDTLSPTVLIFDTKNCVMDGTRVATVDCSDRDSVVVTFRDLESGRVIVKP